MKLLSGQSMKRNQLLRLGKRIGTSSTGSSSSVAIVNVVGRKIKPAVIMRYVPKKLKEQLKQAAIGFQKKGSSSSSLKYSYDMHSYSLNFDDGLCHRKQHCNPDM